MLWQRYGTVYNFVPCAVVGGEMYRRLRSGYYAINIRFSESIDIAKINGSVSKIFTHTPKFYFFIVCICRYSNSRLNSVNVNVQ